MMANCRSKYHNRKITRDGETFDSIKEYQRWCELKLLEKAGEITELKRQVKFKLIPTMREPVCEMSSQGVFKKGKLLEREVSYVADFVYKNRLGFEVVEDVKGYRTEAYVLKRKMMLYFHHIRIQEI
jgi:hypothetical protein